MAIHTHFIAASTMQKPFQLKHLQYFLEDLLREKIVEMPATIFVGEARNDPDGAPWGSQYAKHAIVPNSPGSMLKLGEEDPFPEETFWYYGDEEASFFDALERVPFGEKDCCICFDTLGSLWSGEGWEGALIYILVRPMPIDFPNSWGNHLSDAFIPRNLDHFFILYSSTGALVENEYTSLNPLIAPPLERYFGPDFFIEQAVE